MSEQGRHRGEGDGFFDKVKDFFTGEGENRPKDAEATSSEENWSEENWSEAAPAQDSRSEDVVADQTWTEGAAGGAVAAEQGRGEEPVGEDAAWNDADALDGRADDDPLDPGEDGLGAHDAAGAADAEQRQSGDGPDSAADELIDESRGNEVFDAEAAGADRVEQDEAASTPDRDHADAGDPVTDPDAWDGSGDPPAVEVPQSEAVDRFVSESGDGAADGYEARHADQSDDTPAEDAKAPATPEAAAGSDEMGTGQASGDELEQDAETDEDREQREAEEARAAEEREEQEAEERRQREEEFAREHDPAEHDIEAGEEFRQPGDWVADEDGEPQVQDADGTVHDAGSEEAHQAQAAAEAAGAGGEAGDDGQASADEAGDDAPRDAWSGLVESSIEEVRDGGHGIGSAAPLADGRQPLGHPVKAWHDTCTFLEPGDEGYDGAEPHEWFVSAETAEYCGFRHAHRG